MRRRLALCAVTAAAVALGAPAAQAADLLILNGEQTQLSGSVDYGIVYIDGELRLAGDTTISAGSVYIGPNAYLRTCFVPSAGDTCTAGRSLTIRSATTLTVEPAIDLTGRAGTPRPGGSLVLSGSDVAVGGQITTAGNGAPSGSVSIESRGTATTGSITAYGAPVSISAARNVSVNGDVRTEGNAAIPAPSARVQGGAPVSIGSSGGDVAVRGNVSTWGRDAGAGQGGGGLGADVALSGGDVRVGAVDTTGGNSVDADAGTSGAIRLSARGSLHALGRLDASAGTSTNGPAPGGASVAAGAGGPVALAGGVGVSGGNAAFGGSPGGTLEVSGATVTAGNIAAGGGNATNAAAPRDGGAGGAVSVSSRGAVSLGSVSAPGGSAPAGARGGTGGSVAAAGQQISVGQVSTNGGSTGLGPGADGGAVSLDSDGSLAVGGTLTTSGSGAAGNAPGVYPAGSAGRILLRAAGGTLDVGGPVWATGGRGSSSSVTGVKGGAGGNGGPVDIVARSLGTIVSIVADGGDGGDYGDDQGPGGAGGAIHGYTDGPLLDDLKVVSGDGGDGHPLGSAGARTLEASPTGLAVAPNGTLSWTSRSPAASRFRVLRSIAGAAPEVLTETAGTSIAAAGPMCRPVTLTVVAVHDGVRFISDAPAAVAYTAQPSPAQRCADAPAVTTREKAVARRLSTVRKAKWTLTIPLASAGLGHVDVTLQKGKKKVVKLATAALDVKPGPVALKLALPKGQRRTGRLTLVLVTTSPDGTRKATTTTTVAVRADKKPAKATKNSKAKKKKTAAKKGAAR